MTPLPRPRLRRPHRRLLDVPDEDPLGGMANLFDTGLVFAVALLIALVSFLRLPDLLTPDLAAPETPPRPALEILRRQGIRLERFRVSENILGGQGERLGTAYRLQSGEVVYVPDEPR